jgi:hypothetical protein
MRKFEFGTENEIIKQERDQKKGELKLLQVQTRFSLSLHKLLLKSKG